jgi:hypothetical protein
MPHTTNAILLIAKIEDLGGEAKPLAILGRNRRRNHQSPHIYHHYYMAIAAIGMGVGRAFLLHNFLFKKKSKIICVFVNVLMFLR